jgi:transposase
MGEDRRLGRPSRILETIQEARCSACGDWIRGVLFRAHIEREHPKAYRGTFEGFEVREIPIPTRIAELVASGNYLEDAAGACGIGTATLYRWLDVGAEWEGVELEEVPQEQRIFREFREAVHRAREEATTRLLRPIERQAPTDWRAAAWILERTRPDRFGRRETVRISGEGGGPIRVEYEQKDPDFVREVYERLGGAGVFGEGVPSSESDRHAGENGNGNGSRNGNGRGPR